MNSPAIIPISERVLGPVARAGGRGHKRIAVSFEFFPPKSDEAEENLWKCIRRLEPLDPSFVSVTYGAGGSTRERTHRTILRLLAETTLKPAAHLTCVEASREASTHVRCAAGFSFVSASSRKMVRCVRSRVEPPAP